MAQDRSRSAFDVRSPKHWSSLQAQQGRLLSDDDWNEADAIDKEDARSTRVDVIGASGSPDDGFKLSNPRVNGTNIDFDLLPGTMYAGGLRTTLERSETFSLQKDWLQQTAADRPVLGGAERIDYAYLEVWTQPVTAVEDDELREVALGGPDASVRLRTMRRVRLLPNVGTESCSAAWAALVASLGGLSSDNELMSDATLTIGYAPAGGAAPNLCSPSVQKGYLGAENQAIRVEIGSGNTFLWGFDNASPLYRVQVTVDAQGAQVIHFLQPPKDEMHWPLAQQVVELLPWSAVLPNGEKVAETSGGYLAKVSASYDPNTQNIKVQPSVSNTFGTTWQARSDRAALAGSSPSYFYLRVWNRASDTASPPQIGFVPNTAVPLTGTGLTITIAGTTFRQGDFWIIAARPESPAKVVPWALESGRRAEGIRRFIAPLGIVHWRPGGVQSVFDCRKTFNPLTRQRGCCITVSPLTNWESTIDEVAGDNDLCICFQPGDYTASRTIVLRNKNIQIHGAGGGSRIVGNGVESVFTFQGCTNVEVRDIAVAATTHVQPGKGAPKPHLSGAITTVDCDHVDIRNVIVRCASGPIKSAACIALFSALPADRALASSARVEGCELVVGANQVGLSIVNYGRSTVSDNSLHVDAAENAALPPLWLKDRAYRRVFRRTLFWRYGIVGDGPPKPAGAALVKIGEKDVWIETAKALAPAWTGVVALRKLNLKRVDHLTVGEFLNGLAEDLVYGSGAIGRHNFPAFQTHIAASLALRTSVTKVRAVAGQGIVVAGTVANDLRIVGNTVRDFVQGIHVGASARRPRNPGAGAPVSDTVGRVVISGNALYITLLPESVVERHGIFVGNCRSQVIENNHLECERLGTASRLTIDGIRAYGFLGRMAYITRNDLIGFTTGVRIAPVNNIADGSTSMWRVNETISHGAGTVVDTKLKVGTATHVVASGRWLDNGAMS